MVETPKQKEPDAIVIQPHNFFHAGWLDAVLGREPRKFNDANRLVSDVNCEAYADGFSMACETRFLVPDVMRRMTSLKQLVITTRPAEQKEPNL